MKHFIACVFLMICLFSKTYSQKAGVIQIGASVPILKFAADDAYDQSNGGASTGVNIGTQFHYRFSEKGFGVFAGVDFNFNGLQQDYMDKLEFRYGTMRIKSRNTKYSQYLNMPITAGLNYMKINHKVGIFANAGLALNILAISKMEVQINEETLTRETATTNGIGYKIGGGLLIDQHITLSFDYLALGRYNIASYVKREVSGKNVPNEDYKLKVHMMTFTVGFRIE